MATFHLTPEELTRLAQAEGFDLAGIVALEAEDRQGTVSGGYLEQWIASGHAGEMEYLKRRNEQGELLRSQVKAAIPWARSVIVCAASYNAPGPRSIDPAAAGTGWIARYAWAGQSDPQPASSAPLTITTTLLARLRSLEAALHRYILRGIRVALLRRHRPSHRARPGPPGRYWLDREEYLHAPPAAWLHALPLLHRHLARRRAGQRPRPAIDRCGTCRRCIEACPTDALIAPYRMDASRCIAYLTIEKRGPIPEELRAPIGRQVFGCDICQEVCPWNDMASRKAGPREQAANTATRPELINPALSWLAGLTPEEFNRQFRGSPIKRTKRSGLLRNVAIAMGNSGDPEYLPQLEAWAGQAEDPVLAEAARWAINLLMSAEGNQSV